MAAMTVHNFDALVTKDYLDTRFGEFEVRIGREMDRRFNLVYWMQGITIACVVIPAIHGFLG